MFSFFLVTSKQARLAAPDIYEDNATLVIKMEE